MSYEKQEWTNNISSIDEEKMNHIENGIYNNSINIEEMQAAIFYKPGDTYSTTYTPIAGHITGGTKQIEFSLFLPKKLDNIQNITITNLTAFCRGIKGYINNDSSNQDFMTSGYTVSCTKRTSNLLTFVISSTDAFTNVDNNTPVILACYIDLTFN